MANDTKERILVAALEMFSQNGYAGTNIRELSASLGLVKSGVYKHYESKEAIWNALLDHMITYYALCRVQKVFKWNNHFQKEQKSTQEDKSEKRRLRLLRRNCSQAWISRD